jgi:EXLDI family protein
VIHVAITGRFGVRTSCPRPTNGSWGLANLVGIRILLRMEPTSSRSYDVHVPNKTIYVSESDLPLFQRAQELAGGNLSSAIARALRRYVDIEDGKREGFDEIIVRVGPKAGRKVRFSGILLAMWEQSTANLYVVYRAFRSRSGKYVLHVERTPEYTALDAEGKPAGWRGWVGLGNVNYSTRPGERTIEVFETLEAFREKAPPQLYDLVAASAGQPVLEDLDI